MVTYKVVETEQGYTVVVKETGVVVEGPYETKGAALASANLRASLTPGNRVES